MKKSNVSPTLVHAGYNSSGKKTEIDLSTLPHLLIGGGKNMRPTLLHAVLSGLIARNTPDRLVMVLLDLGEGELLRYRGAPHLLEGVVTDREKAEKVLRHIEREMQRRLNIIREEGAQNYAEYCKTERVYTFPPLIVAVDEVFGLITPNDRESAMLIGRIAAQGRRAGIHLLLTVRNYTADSALGYLKANFPSRAVMRTADENESRLLFDRSGAEKLQDENEVLLWPLSAVRPRKLKVLHVSDEEIQAMIALARRKCGLQEEI